MRLAKQATHARRTGAACGHIAACAATLPERGRVNLPATPRRAQWKVSSSSVRHQSPLSSPCLRSGCLSDAAPSSGPLGKFQLLPPAERAFLRSPRGTAGSHPQENPSLGRSAADPHQEAQRGPGEAVQRPCAQSLTFGPFRPALPLSAPRRAYQTSAPSPSVCTQAPLATLHRLEDVHGTWSSYMEKTGHAMPGSSKKARPVAADVADTAGAAGKPGVARQVKRARAGTAGKRASAAPGRARR